LRESDDQGHDRDWDDNDSHSAPGKPDGKRDSNCHLHDHSPRLENKNDSGNDRG
jgi:hypothetical protein